MSFAIVCDTCDRIGRFVTGSGYFGELEAPPGWEEHSASSDQPHKPWRVARPAYPAYMIHRCPKCAHEEGPQNLSAEIQAVRADLASAMEDLRRVAECRPPAVRADNLSCSNCGGDLAEDTVWCPRCGR